MKKLSLSLIFCLIIFNIFAQNTKVIESPSGTVISNAGGDDIPNSSTILEIRSTDKGILIPRMTTTEREAIPRPPTGLLVFDSTTDKFWFYNGQAWSKITADNNVKFGFDLVKTTTLTSTYDLSYLGNYNFDPTTVTLPNATTLHLQRAGLYRFGLLGIKHLESAASAVASSATFNLYLTVNTKQYNVIANGVQAGGGSTWSFGSSSTLTFDLYIPSNSTLKFSAVSSNNSGFGKSDTGHFFGYLISD